MMALDSGKVEARPVAVLCVKARSIYRELPNVEAWDAKRDAWKFPGGMPVVAHPPCRSWSAFCKHQAKPLPGEQALGLFCAEQVKKHGGILEQPAFSGLWEAANLPKPGWRHRGELWAIEVWQWWWGYPNLKRTWLLFSKISPTNVHLPLLLHVVTGQEKRRWQLMGKAQRNNTTRAFAEWLVETARRAASVPRGT